MRLNFRVKVSCWFRRMGQQQQQGITLMGTVYAAAAAQLMKMHYVSREHQATDSADHDSASLPSKDNVSPQSHEIRYPGGCA